MASVDMKALLSLEERINCLHTQIFSAQENNFEKKPMELLEQTQCTLKELEKRHVVITQLWKKLPQLDEYLNTDFLQKIQLNDDIKTSLILANEENLKNLANDLKELEPLQNVINRDSLKDIPQHSSKLEPIIQLHLDQVDETHILNERMQKLLNAYDNIISTLSKQFMIWNNLVMQCELALDMKSETIN